MDTNGSGTISVAELEGALGGLGIFAPSSAVDALFASFDHDGGGTIEYHELHDALKGIATRADPGPHPRARTLTARPPTLSAPVLDDGLAVEALTPRPPAVDPSHSPAPRRGNLSPRRSLATGNAANSAAATRLDKLLAADLVSPRAILPPKRPALMHS